MSYQSKFTERFDINPSDSLIQEIMFPTSPRNSSVYSSPEFSGSDNSFHQTTKGTTRPISIPQKKSKSMSMSPPYSPPRNSSEKNHDAFAVKFKQFFSIKKKNVSLTTSI
jgi:hypothetical protein